MKPCSPCFNRRSQAGNSLRRTLCKAAFLALVAAAGTTAHAQTYTWNGGTSDYNTAGNWNGGATPPPDSNTESANFAASSTTTVNVSASTTTQNLFFAAAAPAYTFTGSAGAILTLDQNMTGPVAGNGTALNGNGVSVVATNANQMTFALPIALRNSMVAGTNFNFVAGTGGFLFTSASSLDLTRSNITGTANGGQTAAFSGTGATSFNGAIAFGGSQQQFNFSGSNGATNTVINTFNPSSITATATAGAVFRLRITSGTLNISNNYVVTVGGVAQTATSPNGPGSVEMGSAAATTVAGASYLTFTNTAATPFFRTIVLGGNGGGTGGGTVTFGAAPVGGGQVYASGNITLSSTTNSIATQALSASSGTTLNLTGNITGGVATNNVTITGGGAVVLNGTSTSVSAVNVIAGTLLGNGTLPSGLLTVSSGANLAPGASTATAGGTTAGSVGILRAGALTLSSGSSFNVLLNDNASATGAGAGTAYSQLVANGVTLAGNLNLTLGNTLAVGDKFFILLNGAAVGTPVSGTFANVAGPTFTSGGNTFLINYADTGDATAGNDISLTVTAVPEPATWVGAGLLCAVLVGRGLHRRQQRA